MAAKTIRLISCHRPPIPNEEAIRGIVTRLGSIGYKISIFDAASAWQAYCRAKHPVQIITDDGSEWVFVTPPKNPHEILEALRPYVKED